MNIDWQIVADTGYLTRTGDEVGKFMASAPTLIEKLHEKYGGVLPEHLVVILIHGPVEIKVDIRHGKLSRRETTGTCIREDTRAWILLSITPGIGRAAIHEFLHMLGITKESTVAQAVEDFVRLMKWEVSASV